MKQANFPIYQLNEHGLIILYHTIELGNLANYKWNQPMVTVSSSLYKPQQEA